MTGDGEVTKRRVKEGIGEFPLDCPLEDSAVRVHFKCYSPDTGKVGSCLILPPASLSHPLLLPLHVLLLPPPILRQSCTSCAPI